MPRGTQAERSLRDKFRREGWTVVRSAASATPIDLVVWNDQDIRLIQVKSATSKKIASEARSRWRQEARACQWPPEVPVQLWLWYHPERRWIVWDYVDGELYRKAQVVE